MSPCLNSIENERSFVMKKLCVVVLASLLAACGSGLDGSYTDSMGTTTLTFESDDKVLMNVMGVETELDYRVEDGKLKISSPMGTQVMSILDDGSIEGPMGFKLTKQEK